MIQEPPAVTAAGKFFNRKRGAFCPSFVVLLIVSASCQSCTNAVKVSLHGVAAYADIFHSSSLSFLVCQRISHKNDDIISTLLPLYHFAKVKPYHYAGAVILELDGLTVSRPLADYA